MEFSLYGTPGKLSTLITNRLRGKSTMQPLPHKKTAGSAAVRMHEEGSARLIADRGQGEVLFVDAFDVELTATPAAVALVARSRPDSAGNDIVFDGVFERLVAVWAQRHLTEGIRGALLGHVYYQVVGLCMSSNNALRAKFKELSDV